MMGKRFVKMISPALVIAGCFTEIFSNTDGEALIQELTAYLEDNEL